MTRYEKLVQALTSLEQNDVTLPMTEDEWRTRPEAESYGLVSFDFEAASLNGDSIKLDAAYEGSVDLFSRNQRGGGWRALIEAALQAHCGACWGLNSYQYERETGLGHWEWTFQITDEEAGDE